MPEWLKRNLDRLKATHAFASWQRYGSANGDLLAAGVAYFAFFSVFPAVALAFAIFGFVLQGRPELLTEIADALNRTLPGMVKTAGNPTGVISIEAPSSLTLTVTGVVSFVTLLLAGLGWVGAVRTGIRGVFGFEASAGNAVRTKARDLLVLATLGLAVAVSAVLTSAAGGLTEQVADWVGIPGSGFVVALVGVVVGLGFDTLIMVLLLRTLSEVPLPWAKVRPAALIGASALTVLKLVGGFLIGRATANPLLGAVAVSVGLLFWLNLISRVVLLSAAWAAGSVDRGAPAGPDDEAPGVSDASGASDASGTAGETVPARVRASQPTLAPASAPASAPTRAVDRASVAAGFVLGGATVAAASSARRLRRVLAR